MDLILIVSLFAMLLYLGVESYLHRSRLKKIPRKIAVTGIRGKSSITRLIASGLREAGFRVMAKTTGSKPVLIYPDGREEEIKRRGRPTVLEQKKLVKKAVKGRAEFLVAEMMSIQPECLQVESGSLLKPEILVVSSIRPDHLESMGKNREEIARTLAGAFPARSLILIPEEEYFPWMGDEARRKESEVLLVKKETEVENLKNDLSYPEFGINVSLAVASVEHLGLNREQIVKGLKKVRPDYGCLRSWKKSFGDIRKSAYFVSLFAANDPQSTKESMELVVKKMGWQNQKVFGLLSLRGDRLDRTRQWADFLIEEKPDYLNRLALVGPGSSALKRYLKKSLPGAEEEIIIIKNQDADGCLKEIISLAPEPGSEIMIFGMGNIVGFGQKMIEYLEKVADAVRL
jgi:poly-gamma-glutamate synthase PgsB/CapB